MELEFYQELFLTAVISVLFALLLGKIAGVGQDDGESSVDSLASSHLSSSGENLGGQGDLDLRPADDGFGTGAESEIAGVEEEGGGIEVVREIVEEMALSDNVGKEEEEEISEEMPELADIAGHCAEDLREEERDGELKEAASSSSSDVGKEKEAAPSSSDVGEEKEAASSSSDVKLVRGQWTESGSGRVEDVRTENKGGSLLHGEDEWEGIERSELENRFGMAAEYSVSTSGSLALSRLSNDVQMELYGLHKIATEGPCYESQPLSLKVSARSKWHAWQKLGRMTPEVAMEQHISLLSKNIPGWAVENSEEESDLKRAADDIQEKGTLDIGGHPDFGPSLQNQLSPTTQMKLEDHNSEIDSTTGGMKILGKGLTGTILLNLLFPTRGVFS